MSAEEVPMIGFVNNAAGVAGTGYSTSVIIYYPVQPLQTLVFSSYYAKRGPPDEERLGPGWNNACGGVTLTATGLYAGPVGHENVTVVPSLHPNN